MISGYLVPVFHAVSDYLPGAPTPKRIARLTPYSIRIVNAHVSKCARRVARRAWLTISTCLPYMRTARPNVYILPLYRAFVLPFLHAAIF